MDRSKDIFMKEDEISTIDLARTVKLQVGDAQQPTEFVVHEHIITARSKFFNAALKDGWKEADERVVKLPEDDPKVVEQYVLLLYGQKISFDHQSGPKSKKITKIIFNEKSHILCNSYVFGEKIQDVKLKNTIMEAMHALWGRKQPDDTNHTPDTASVRIIYDGTAGTCPPRRLVVQLYARRSRPSWGCFITHKHPLEFIADLSMEFASFPKPKGDVPWMDGSQYQETE